MIGVDIVAACWVVFMLYWGISARNVKKDLRRSGSLWISVAWRLLLAVAVILSLRVPFVRQLVKSSLDYFALSIIPTRDAGIVFCVAGIAFAIWARANLGTNWSQRPSVKEGHELVTSGPYQRVRHPIYFGILLAILGTAFVTGIPGLVAFLIVCVVFINRIRVEERIMMNLFPDEYPEYRKRTKALIPYIV